jgi:plasmid stabilization system protein ParE
LRLIWAPVALEQAEAALDYIAQDRPAAAARWLDGLFQRVDVLRDLPEQGRLVPEARRRDLRELIYGSYRVIYRVRQEEVSILLVRHSRQHLDPEELQDLP